MYVTHNEMVVLKMNLLGGMYSFIGQDEDAYSEWIIEFPDEPSEEDLREIAEDEKDWVRACTLFGQLVKQYELN